MVLGEGLCGSILLCVGCFVCAKAVTKYLVFSDLSRPPEDVKDSAMPWFTAVRACSPPSQVNELEENIE